MGLTILPRLLRSWDSKDIFQNGAEMLFVVKFAAALVASACVGWLLYLALNEEIG